MAYDLKGKAVQLVELSVVGRGYGAPTKVIMAKQNDVNSRFIRAKLHDEHAILDCTGCEVQLNATLPDGSVICSYGEVHDGQPCVKLTGDMLAEVGKLTCDITVTGKYDDIDISVGDSTGIIAASYDKAKFEEEIITAGTYTFTYDGSNSSWKYNDDFITLEDYGISVDGTPVNGDTVIIKYSNSYVLTSETFIVLVHPTNYNRDVATDGVDQTDFLEYVKAQLGDIKSDIQIINNRAGTDLYVDVVDNKLYLTNTDGQIVGDGVRLPDSVNGFITETDENGNNYLYLAKDGEIVGDGVELPSGGGGGGGGSSYVVRVINNLGTTTLNAAFNESCKLNFTAKEFYGQSQTNSQVTVVYTVRTPNATTYATVLRKTAAQDVEIEEDISQFLEIGVNSVRVAVTGGESGITKTTTYTINVVEIYMTSSFNYKKAYNTSFAFPYKCFGKSLNKTVYFEVDGQSYTSVDVGTTHNVQLSQTIDLSSIEGMTHGNHELKVYFKTADGAMTTPLVYDVIYYANSTDTIIASSFPVESEVTYGNNIEVKYVTFTYGSEFTPTLVRSIYTMAYEQCDETTAGALLVVANDTIIEENEQKIKIVDTGLDTIEVGQYVKYARTDFSSATLSNIVNNQEQTWTIQDYPDSGTMFIELKAGNTIRTFEVFVNEVDSEYDLDIATTRLVASLSTNGRSNNDSARATWRCFYKTLDNITTTIDSTMSDFDYVSNGWITDDDGATTLRHTGKAKTTINVPIFATTYRDADSNLIRFAGSPSAEGRTIEIDFNIHDVTDYNAEVIKCFNNGRGFVITPKHAYLLGNTMTVVQDSNGNITNMESVPAVSFKDGERIRITFVIENVGYFKDGSTNKQMVRVYINGELTSALNYSDSTLFGQTSYLTIGNSACVTDIYNIRMYDMALEDAQVLQNHIATGKSTAEKIALHEDNDVLNASGEIDYYACRKKYPCMLVTGTLSGYKGDKTKVGLIYTKPDATAEEGYSTEMDCMDIIDGNYICQSNVQGTSSQRYAKKNYKFTFKKDVGGVATKAEYKLKGEDSIGEDTLCYKADYMSPNHSNTVNANFLSTLFQEEVPAQENDSRVQTTIYGYRCLLFQRDTAEDTPVFQGDGCLNNDKGNTKTFGLENPDDDGNNTTCQKWEFLDNSEDICNFKTDKLMQPRGNSTAVVSALESCYPDQGDLEDTGLTPDYSHIQIVYTWLYQRANYWTANKKYALCGSTDEGALKIIGDDSLEVAKNEIKIGDLEDLINTVNGKVEAGLYVKLLTDSYSYGDVVYDNEYDYRKAIFNAEFTKHFNKNHVLTYYLGLECLALVDNRAKNLFLTCYDVKSENIVFTNGASSLDDIIDKTTGDVDADKIDWENSIFAIWYTSFYDLDSCLGVDNSGYEIIPYDAEWQAKLNARNLFNGNDSYLWLMVEDNFAEDITLLYKELRDKDYTLSYAKLYEAHITNNADLICETIVNNDQRYKYIDIWTEGYSKYSDDNSSQSLVKTADYLYLVQGSRKHQIAQFMYNRMNMLDSKYINATYKQNKIEMRIGLSGQTDGTNVGLKLTPATTMYCYAEYGNSGEYLGGKTDANTEIAIIPVNGDYGDILLSIYGASNLSSLGDLSKLKPYSVDVSQGVKLKELILGSAEEGYSNPNLTTLNTTNCVLLQKIDIRNTGISNTLDLSNCPLLEEIYATGSNISEISLPSGGYLKKLYLPDTLTTFVLRNQNSIEDFEVEGTDALQTLVIENCSDSIMNKSAELLRDSVNSLTGGIRLTGFSWNLTSDGLNWSKQQIITLLNGLTSDDIKGKQIDASGSLVDDENAYPILTGEIFVGNMLTASEVTNHTVIAENYPALTVWSWNVTWKDKDDNIVGTEKILNGATAHIPAEGIVEEYEKDGVQYQLAGFSVDYTNITSDAVITPIYSEVYEVIFKDKHGTILKQEEVIKGNSATAPDEVPNTTDDGYKYTFKGWDKSFGNVTEDMVVTAVYDKYFTVTFIDYQDQVLATQDVVEGKNATPPTGVANYTGEDGQVYAQTSWDVPYTNIAGDITIKAVYSPVWTVIFQNYDGTLLDTQYVVNGGDAKYYSGTVTKPATAQCYYTFDGWDKLWTNITEDTVLTAKFVENTQTYSVQFYEDEKLSKSLFTGLCGYGSTIVYGGADLTIPDGFFFQYWIDNYGNQFTTNSIAVNESNAFLDASGSKVTIKLYPVMGMPTIELPTTEKTFGQCTAWEQKAISNFIGATSGTYPASEWGVITNAENDYTVTEVATGTTATVTYDATEDAYTVTNTANNVATTVAIHDTFDMAIGDDTVQTMQVIGFLCDEDGAGQKRGISVDTCNLYKQVTKCHYYNSHGIINLKVNDVEVVHTGSNKDNVSSYTLTCEEEQDVKIVSIGDSYIDYIKVTDADENNVYYLFGATTGTNDETNTYNAIQQTIAKGGALSMGAMALDATNGAFTYSRYNDSYRFTMFEEGSKISLHVTAGSTVLIQAAKSYNVGGYKYSDYRNYLTNDLYELVTPSYKSLMVAVKKGSTKGFGVANVEYMYDKMWALSYSEVGFETSSPYGSEGSPYPAYTNNESRIKKYNNGTSSAYWWWLRSPFCGGSYYFRSVYSSGNSDFSYANNYYGVAFGFSF